MEMWRDTHFSVVTVHFADGRPAEGYTDCDNVTINQGVLQFGVYHLHEVGLELVEVRGYSLAYVRSYEVVRGTAKPEAV